MFQSGTDAGQFLDAALDFIAQGGNLNIGDALAHVTSIPSYNNEFQQAQTFSNWDGYFPEQHPQLAHNHIQVQQHYQTVKTIQQHDQQGMIKSEGQSSADTQQNALTQTPAQPSRPKRTNSVKLEKSKKNSDLCRNDTYSDHSESDDDGESGDEDLPDIDDPAGTSSAIVRKLGKNRRVGRKAGPKAYDALIDPRLPPAEIRRLRRIMSNRESARRCRARRAAQMDALEGEMNTLKQEKRDVEQRLMQLEAQMQSVLADNQRLQQENSKLLLELQTSGTSSALEVAELQTMNNAGFDAVVV